ncbi:hypothetical protein CJU16_18250 [Pseudomonas aeruginosa]|nr:hypothetical protein AO986_01880 [Pseudomonas aeruginosa]PBW17878.1 hypothetical protein CJU17_16085 [Pseudomonas aeruginosa]PBW23511.1 hypothetical protein CJU16_18250 [Pseudomonas aeruginosa]PBW30330.1 hypothetical protein CJU14_13650 [Pseudomonas aeruginosa]PCA60597.1 hypothetical protein CJU15_12285 [Pseudomonas aeruginosa]
MLRDSHQFIVCIERTALAEDDRIRMHDASHHLRPLRLFLLGLLWRATCVDPTLIGIVARFRVGLRQGGATSLPCGVMGVGYVPFATRFVPL